MGRGNQTSSRKRFFKDLDNIATSAFPAISENEHTTALQQLDHRINILPETVYENVQLGSRMSSRKRFFQQLNDKEESDNEGEQSVNDVENAANIVPYGQAHYQRQNRGVVIEYKDFGDNTYQCAHCNAYYWHEERNTRGIYTGCCKRGKVKLQPPNPTPPFLEYLLNPNNGAKDQNQFGKIWQLHFRRKHTRSNARAFTLVGCL